MTLSCVIPTLNRPGLALEVVKLLAEQSRLPDEVVLVSQTVDGSPVHELSEIAGMPFPLKILHHTPLGTSGARNRGADQACGEILLFLDDDVRFGANFVARYLDFFQREPLIEVIQGGVHPVGETLPDVRRFRTSDAFHAIVGVPLWSHRSMAIGLGSGNLGIRRSAFYRVGGFDEQLRGKGEDMDLGLRLFLAGAVIVHEPAVCVVHLKMQTGGLRDSSHGPARSGIQPSLSLSPLFYVLLKNLPRPAAEGMCLALTYNYFRAGPDNRWRWLKWPGLLIIVLRSWRQALRMLAFGPIYTSDHSLATKAAAAGCAPPSKPAC